MGGNKGYNYGPMALDGRSGFIFQRRFMTYQKGVLVSRLRSDGTWDLPDTY